KNMEPAVKRDYYETFRKGNFQNLNELFFSDLEEKSRDIFNSIEQLTNSADFETIFVIPPANLLDWERRTPLLKGDTDPIKWHQLLHETQLHIEHNEFEQALNCALHMNQVDNGSNSSSKRLVAQSLLALKNSSQAIDFLKEEAELAIANSNLTSFPVTPAIISSTVKKGDYSFVIIDLEAEILKMTNQEILGENVFVDYCHLNPYGFSLFASIITKHILKIDTLSKNYNETDICQSIEPQQLSAIYLYIA
ncbi:hypothetical protein, partial [Photobacterium damselae]|uniref:hypothetical protein n=1 Tax=Photobacterium damselae TaxID=38293 RepID=UPI002F424757